MNKKLSVFFLCWLYWGGQGVWAKTIDPEFEKWKNQQILHDQRLSANKSDNVEIQQKIVQVQPTSLLTLQHTKEVQQQLGDQVIININTATSQEIVAKLDSIGQKKAKAIIDYRDQYGAFKTIDDLLKVKGIGQKTLEKNRKKIILN